MDELYTNGASPLTIGQQRIAVVPDAQHYPAFDVQPEWIDSIISDGKTTQRIRHDYRGQEIVAESGPFQLVRLARPARYRQGV